MPDRRYIPMRSNFLLDDELLAEAFKVSDAKTKRQLIHEALRELVAQRRRMDLRELRGSDGIAPDFDYKALRQG